MKEVQCLNCGHEFELTSIYEDRLGTHTICPKCKASFDIEEHKEEL